MAELNSPKKSSGLFSSENLTLYLYISIFLLFILIIFSLFVGTNKDVIESEESRANSSSQVDSAVNINQTEYLQSEMKSVELLNVLVENCNSYLQSQDAESYCTSFKKVDFDGLQVFVNCEYADVKSELQSSLSCTDYQMSALEVCQENKLNGNEFVGVNGNIFTCYQANLM